MKEKLKQLFSKNSSYYEVDEENLKKKPISPQEELKQLKKELEKLKQNLPQKALEKFKTRRSIRKFSDQQIDFKIIFNIIEGALNAPCAGNVQNYKIIQVTDKKIRHELGKVAFQQFWLSDAPVILVVVRDDYDLIQLYPQEGKTYSIQNTAALIENILMLAHFYDLGACWVEAYDNEVLKELLSIPPQMRVDAIIPIGYPLENPTISKNPTDQMLFYNSFGNKKRK